MLDWQVLKTRRINFSFELVKKMVAKKSVAVFVLICRKFKKKFGQNSDTII